MIVVPFMREDLESMAVQPDQRDSVAALDDTAFDMIERSESYTVLHEDEPIACMGIVPMAVNRAWIWAFLAEGIKHRMVGLTRLTGELIDASPFTIIEGYVISGNDKGAKWMQMLGFDLAVANVPNLRGTGDACDIYVKVKR